MTIMFRTPEMRVARPATARDFDATTLLLTSFIVTIVLVALASTAATIFLMMMAG